MKKSTRLLVTLVVIEALLFCIAAMLLNSLNAGTLHAANDPRETAQGVLSIFGGAMGMLAAVVGPVVLLMRRKGL